MEDPLDAVVPDATSAEFLDSSGLRVLLRGARVVEGVGIAFRLVAPPVRPSGACRSSIGAFRALDVRPSLPETLA